MIPLPLRWCLSLALTLRGAGRRIDPEVANATALTREILAQTGRRETGARACDAPGGATAL